MSQFDGMYVSDDKGKPLPMTEDAAKGIEKAVTEPIKIIPNPNGTYFVRVGGPHDART